MIKQSIVFIIILLLSTSCDKQIKHTFYYSDGNVISDTNQLKVLTSELNKTISSEQLEKDLKIYTCLSSKLNADFRKISTKYQGYVLDTLKKQYPEKIKHFDSLNLINNISRIATIVINNKTAEIENCAFNMNSQNAIFDNNLESKAIQPYGYIMAFEKGMNLHDTFNSEFNRKVDMYKNPEDITVTKSFYMVPSGSIMSRPFNFYTKLDWENIEKKIILNLDLSEFQPGPFASIKTNLYDLTKTIFLIQNDGYYQRPILIKLVKNSDGTKIFSSSTVKKQKLLDDSVVKKMKMLFNDFMTLGQGRIHYKRNKIIEDCFFFTGSLHDYMNWSVYSNEKYTIGIIEYNYLNVNGSDIHIHRRREKLKVGLVVRDLLESLNSNNVIGENLKLIEKMDADEN